MYIKDKAITDHFDHIRALYFNQPEIMADLKKLTALYLGKGIPQEWYQVDFEQDGHKATFYDAKLFEKYMKKVVL